MSGSIKGQKRNGLSHVEAFKVGTFLSTICKTENEFALYSDEWNDDSVSEYVKKTFNFECTPANVAGLRKELFGPMRKAVVVPTIVDWNAIDERLRRLELWAKSRPVEPFAK